MPLIALLLAGILLAAVKLVYSFLPLFNVLDVLVFFGAAMLATRRTRVAPIPAALLIATPTVVLCASFLWRLAPGEPFSSGVGLGWLASVVLVAVSSLTGAWVGVGPRRRAGAQALR